MEQYRLEIIEMTDLGQSAEWAQEMQKAIEEDKQHEHHTADAGGMGGGAAPVYGGHRRRGGGGGAAAGGGGEGVGGGGDAAATGQGAAGDINAGAVTAVGGGPPKAFIMHHTGGRGTAAGVQATLKQRGLGVQYVMDREGNITRIGGPGAHHIMSGTGVGAGLSNRNVVGMEVIARNDADVTPAQIAAGRRFIQKYYPNTPVYGHGEVNPGHKEASEGMSITRAIRGDRRSGRFSGDDAGATAGVQGAADSQSGPAPEYESASQHQAEKHRKHAMRQNLFHSADRGLTPRHRSKDRNPSLHQEVHRPERSAHREHVTPPPHHRHPHPRRFPMAARHANAVEPSSTPTPPSRSFAGIQGLAGSPSGPAPERPPKL